MKCSVKGSPTEELAVLLGRSVVNSPLLKCAVSGNDPNVGRLVAAVGKFVGDHRGEFDQTLEEGARAVPPLVCAGSLRFALVRALRGPARGSLSAECGVRGATPIYSLRLIPPPKKLA